MSSRSFQLARRFTLGSLGILLFLLGSGAATEWILEHGELDAYPPPGRLIDAGGHRLHIQCTGPTGASPTVVLDADSAAFSAVWALIQKEAAKTARVCSYDRAGLGWSEPGPRPRNAATAARELQVLLLHSGETGPYVLVGHSYGGIVIRKYVDATPEEVAGLVFVDPSFPRRGSLRSRSEREQGDHHIQRLHRLTLLGRLGILRVYPELLDEALPPTGHKLYDSIRSWPRHIQATAHELERMDESLGDPAFESQDFGDRPVIVLSENAGKDRVRLRSKREEHRRLADRSQRGAHIVVDGASPLSFLTDPGHAMVVVTAINEVLNASRPGS